MALYDWGLTPEYINDRWTEELLQYMFASRHRRQLRLLSTARKKRRTWDEPEDEPVKTVMTDTELFRKWGFEVEKR